MRVILVLLCAVAALFEDPDFFTWGQVSLKARVVLADHSPNRVVVTVTDIVRPSWNFLRLTHLVGHQSLSVWSQSLQNLSVERSVFVRAVFPWLRLGLVAVNVLKIIMEEVSARNKLAAVPLSDVTTLNFRVAIRSVLTPFG